MRETPAHSIMRAEVANLVLASVGRSGRIKESPADRVAQALMDALRDFAVAIWNERSPDDRAQFARVIADAQTELLKSQATLETLHVLPR